MHKAISTVAAVGLLVCGTLGGCASSPVAKTPAQAIRSVPHDPIAGSWKGQWHSDAEGGGHRATVSVVPVGNGTTYMLSLKMSRIEDLLGGLDIPDIKLQKQPDGTLHFEAKIPLAQADSGYVAQAMQLKGQVAGDRLTINYSTNDAIKDIDHGEIDLTRVRSSI